MLGTMGFHKSTLVARDANSQLDPSCVSVPPAINVDLFACFAERWFKSSSISYLSCRRVASDNLYLYVNRQNSQSNAILALNSIERPATFYRL